jgi:hypothetical protein
MVGLSNGASIILFGKNLHSPLLIQSLPYAPCSLRYFENWLHVDGFSLRGVGSTLRGVVPYGTESSRRLSEPEARWDGIKYFLPQETKARFRSLRFTIIQRIRQKNSTLRTTAKLLPTTS